MIYAVVANSRGNNVYPRTSDVLGLLGIKPYSRYEVVVLNGLLLEGVYEATGPYCPIRYELPAPTRNIPVHIRKPKIPWSHLPPKRKTGKL